MAATAGSTIRGIRTAADLADAGFVSFFRIVQDAAARAGGVFFLWSGEGHELIDDELDGEDLSGWLVPFERADEFELKWLARPCQIGDDFDDDAAFARWSKDSSGNIAIDFEFPLRGVQWRVDAEGNCW